MADFPNSIYSTRETQNLPGITFDPADKKNLYSEDFQGLGAEITAIEETLGENPQGSSDTVGDRIALLETNHKRVVSVTQSATPAIDTDNGDIFQIFSLAQAITSLTTNLTGTPFDTQYMMLQIRDNGTARALSFGSKFASTTVSLPTTTVASTLLRIGFQYNGATSKWDCIGVV